MTRSTRTRLGVTALEAREVPAAGVTILGDLMIVEGYPGVRNQISVSRPSVGRLGVSIVTEQGDGWGGSYREYTEAVRTLSIIGRDKNDDLTNYTDLPAWLYGYEGNDRLTSAGGADWLYGHGGTDSLTAGGGADRLFGGGDNDTLNGGTGDDVLRGGDGNDTLNGDANADKLYGEMGADALGGGSGADVLFGGVNDINYGTADFPRHWSKTDTYHGGTGADRFLMDNVDAYAAGGQDPHDAPILLAHGATDSLGGMNHWATRWTHTEVERLDGAFQIAFDRTSNNALLRVDGDETLVCTRVGGLNPAAGAWNDDGNITFPDNGFRGTDAGLHELALHEIGHNFDDENPNWGAFKQVSGWIRATELWNRPDLQLELARNASRYQRIDKYGEVWYYRTDSEFYSDYAKTHPEDDFAESFAAVLMGKAAAIPRKAGVINAWLDGLSW